MPAHDQRNCGPCFRTFRRSPLGNLRLLALLVPLFMHTNVYGEGWSFDDARPDWGTFALGFASGYVGHELGHYVVATSKGYQVGHDGLSLVYSGRPFTAADHLQIASAGFQTQWLLTELVFRDRNGREIKAAPGNLGAGVVCAHLGITLAYLVYLKDNQQGDIVGMSAATGYSNNRIAAVLAVPGALDAWRLFGHQVPEWVPQLSLLGKGLGLAWVWTY